MKLITKSLRNDEILKFKLNTTNYSAVFIDPDGNLETRIFGDRILVPFLDNSKTEKEDLINKLSKRYMEVSGGIEGVIIEGNWEDGRWAAFAIENGVIIDQ